MFRVKPIACLMAIFLAGCTPQPGMPLNNAPWSSGPKVYHDAHVKKQYVVVKPLHIRLRQIVGPNYYDDLATIPMISRQAQEIGADAVINYSSRRIPGENILDPGYFEVSGTAIRFTK